MESSLPVPYVPRAADREYGETPDCRGDGEEDDEEGECHGSLLSRGEAEGTGDAVWEGEYWGC